MSETPEGNMDLDSAYKLHADLCTMHNNVSKQALALPYGSPAYYGLNAIADKLSHAADMAYDLFKRLYAEQSGS